MRWYVVMDGLEGNGLGLAVVLFKVGTCGAILSGITGSWELI